MTCQLQINIALNKVFWAAVFSACHGRVAAAVSKPRSSQRHPLIIPLQKVKVACPSEPWQCSRSALHAMRLNFTEICSLRTLFCLDYESLLQNLLSLEAASCILRRSHVLSGRCSTSKDLMKYGPIPQSKVCKQSNTANWHLLSPIHHCLTLSHTLTPPCPPLLFVFWLTSCVPLISSSKCCGAKVKGRSVVSLSSPLKLGSCRKLKKSASDLFSMATCISCLHF